MMNTKRFVFLLLAGTIVTLLGALAKIMHIPFSNILLLIGLLINIAAAVLFSLRSSTEGQ